MTVAAITIHAIHAINAHASIDHGSHTHSPAPKPFTLSAILPLETEATPSMQTSDLHKRFTVHQDTRDCADFWDLTRLPATFLSERVGLTS